MSLYLLDTDHLSLYQMGHPRVLQEVSHHVADHLAISVVTVEEQLAGWQGALRKSRDDVRREKVYQRMARAVESLSSWHVIPFSLTAMSRHTDLVRQRLNIASNDLKIAATALEHSATVVTRNKRDFARVPGISCEDWST